MSQNEIGMRVLELSTMIFEILLIVLFGLFLPLLYFLGLTNGLVLGLILCMKLFVVSRTLDNLS